MQSQFLLPVASDAGAVSCDEFLWSGVPWRSCSLAGTMLTSAPVSMRKDLFDIASCSVSEPAVMDATDTRPSRFLPARTAPGTSKPSVRKTCGIRTGHSVVEWTSPRTLEICCSSAISPWSLLHSSPVRWRLRPRIRWPGFSFYPRAINRLPWPSSQSMRPAVPPTWSSWPHLAASAGKQSSRCPPSLPSSSRPWSCPRALPGSRPPRAETPVPAWSCPPSKSWTIEPTEPSVGRTILRQAGFPADPALRRSYPRRVRPRPGWTGSFDWWFSSPGSLLLLGRTRLRACRARTLGVWPSGCLLRHPLPSWPYSKGSKCSALSNRESKRDAASIRRKQNRKIAGTDLFGVLRPQTPVPKRGRRIYRCRLSCSMSLIIGSRVRSPMKRETERDESVKRTECISEWNEGNQPPDQPADTAIAQSHTQTCNSPGSRYINAIFSLFKVYGMLHNFCKANDDDEEDLEEDETGQIFEQPKPEVYEQERDPEVTFHRPRVPNRMLLLEQYFPS